LPVNPAAGWDKALDEKHVNWMLMPTSSSLSNMLKLEPRWTLVYEASTATPFRRKPWLASQECPTQTSLLGWGFLG
jgi:hypothetical protein